MKDRHQEQIKRTAQWCEHDRGRDEEMERADLRRYLREQMSAHPNFSARQWSCFLPMSHARSRPALDNPLGTVKTRLELDCKITRLAKASATQDLTMRTNHVVEDVPALCAVRKTFGALASKVDRSPKHRCYLEGYCGIPRVEPDWYFARDDARLGMKT